MCITKQIDVCCHWQEETVYAGFKGDEPTGGMCILTVCTHVPCTMNLHVHVHTLYNVIMQIFIRHIILRSIYFFLTVFSRMYMYCDSSWHVCIYIVPAVGPLCEYKSTPAASDLLSDCSSTLADYEAVLTAPDPACGADSTTNIIIWTPNNSTADLVYYQVCTCVCVCVRACVRACVCACVRVCACVCVYIATCMTWRCV